MVRDRWIGFHLLGSVIAMCHTRRKGKKGKETVRQTWQLPSRGTDVELDLIH